MSFSRLRAQRAPLALSLLTTFVSVLVAPTGKARAEDPAAGVLVEHSAPLATPELTLSPELKDKLAAEHHQEPASAATKAAEVSPMQTAPV